MQILLGIGCIAIYYATKMPLRIVNRYDINSNWYNSADELFLFFLNWILLIVGIGLVIIGLAKIIKFLIHK